MLTLYATIARRIITCLISEIAFIPTCLFKKKKRTLIKDEQMITKKKFKSPIITHQTMIN